MTDRIHLTVGVVCEKDGKLLMVEERDKQTRMRVLNQPAGHIEPGETFKQAALREALEETGYQLELEALLGLSCYPAPNGVTYYRVSFLASCPDQTPSANIDSEIDAVYWMTVEDIMAADNHRSKLVAMDIERYLEGTRYPLEMISEAP
jgi:ADP-ribose pyrophosphatase YjhB (NUDIX family)